MSEQDLSWKGTSSPEHTNEGCHFDCTSRVGMFVQDSMYLKLFYTVTPCWSYVSFAIFDTLHSIVLHFL